MGQRARRGLHLGEIDRVGVPALGRGQGRSKGVTLLQHNMQDQSLWDARDLLYNMCQGSGYILQYHILSIPLKELRF